MVYNHCSQLHDALLLPNQPDPHVLYNWVIQQEMDYITRTKQKGLRQRVMPSPSTSSQTHSKNSPQSSEQHLAKPTPTPSSNELPPKPSLRSISQQNLWTSTDSSSSSEEEKEKQHPEDVLPKSTNQSEQYALLCQHLSKADQVEAMRGYVAVHFFDLKLFKQFQAQLTKEGFYDPNYPGQARKPHVETTGDIDCYTLRLTPEEYNRIMGYTDAYKHLCTERGEEKEKEKQDDSLSQSYGSYS